MIENRQLGRQGLVIPAIGLGCMGMTGAYGRADEAESVATIHRALEIGVTMFDTADVYSSFANEKLVGEALAGRRDQAIVATRHERLQLRARGYSASDASSGAGRGPACSASW